MPPVTIDGTNGITTPMYSGAISANAVTPSVNMKSRIINGAMVIDQRNAGASISVGSSPVYPVDRFQVRIAQGSGHTTQRSTTAPAGFINSVIVTVGTGASPTSGQVSIFNQQIEGFNVADLGWGTADAKTVTVSFWVRSSVTGTYSVAISNNGLDRSYVTNFTISSANTFEYKTVTIAGDTSGTWLKDNGVGMFMFVDLGSGTDREATAGSWGAGWKTRTSGSVQLAATSGATFYITGVQLEVGSTATSFDYRPYGTELALCQRYFYLHAQGNGAQDQMIGTALVYSSSQVEYVLPFKTTMRTSPSLYVSNVSNTFGISNGSYTTTTSTFTIYGGTTNSALIYCTPVASGTTGVAVRLDIASAATSSTYIGFSAEL
jgi:hypothetical protein